MLNKILKEKADLEKLGKKFNDKMRDSNSRIRLYIERINTYYFLKFNFDIKDPFFNEKFDKRILLKRGWTDVIKKEIYVLVKNLAKELELTIGNNKTALWIEK